MSVQHESGSRRVLRGIGLALATLVVGWVVPGLGARQAHAAPPKVVCVPYVPADRLVPHETWSGKATTLKGVARDPDNNLGGGKFWWDFGDGTVQAQQNLTNADNLAAVHTYAAAPGTLFVAWLYVKDAAGEITSDEYRVIVKDKTLDVEVNKAIDDGLWWTYTNRDVSGSTYYWNNRYYGSHTGNSTASAVQAFEINGHLETGDADEDPYVAAVRGGIDYLLANLGSVGVGTLQGGKDPEEGQASPNHIGLQWPSDHPTYETGAVMDALVATGTPNAVARTGGPNVLGRTYKEIVQDMVDVHVWGQSDPGQWGNGGWQYQWNNGAGDNSASQWAAIGMIAAERVWKCTVPAWAKERNLAWLDASYAGGYFGYQGRGANRWYTTGPSGMVEMAFDGKDTSDDRWKECEQFIFNNWNTYLNTGNDARYYGYYALAKSMRLALPQETTRLNGTLDWYGDDARGLARLLVNTQYADGSWPYDNWPYVGPWTATSWNVIILTRTLFEKPPVAVVKAEPNPAAIGQAVRFDGSASYHVDPAKTIVTFLWDFDASDADGVDFDHPDATGATAQWSYGDLRNYTVTLKVLDDSSPVPRFDTADFTVRVTVPPHPPTAVMGGPYVATVGEGVSVDGSGSYDVDQGLGDSITAWDWEANFVAPYDYAEAHGAKPTLPGFATAGRKDIGLRVTDNTAAIFPQSGQPNLTHAVYGEVQVYELGVTNLMARPKLTKCQVDWKHIGSPVTYEVLRSDKGASEGYTVIGTTTSTYSVFIDYNVKLSTSYWYRVRYALNGATYLSAPAYCYSAGRVVNRPPVIRSGPVTAAQEAQPYTYQVLAADPEGQALKYYLDVKPNGMAINLTSGLVTWTPTLAQVGTANVMVRVADTLGAASTQYYTIVVKPRPNQSPTASAGGPYAGLIYQTVSFVGSGADQDGDPLVDYHWSFGDGTEAHGASATHAYSAAALYTVTLYVTDSRGGTGHAETTCQIGLPNRAPTANPGGPYVGEVGKPLAFDGSKSYDPDADPLTYSWSFGDSTQGVGQPTEGEKPAHTYDQLGTYAATLSVSDGRGGTDTAIFVVTVTPPNEPPTPAAAASGLLVTLETVTFDARGSGDSDGAITKYEWDFHDGVKTTGAWVTHAFDSAGPAQATLTVTDDKGASASLTVDLTLTPNQPPQVPAPSVSGALLAGLPIDVSAAGAADPEGGALTFSWSFGDGSPAAQGPSAQHTYATPGDYELRLTVTDHVGIQTEVAQVLSVADPSGPVASFQVSGAMAAGESQTFDGSASHAQGGKTLVSYQWEFGDGASSSGPSASHAYTVPGRYPVKFTVTDSAGVKGVAIGTLDVGANRPPVALLGYSGQMLRGAAISFDGSASYDPENHPLATYSWDFGDGTPAVTGARVTHAFGSAGDPTVVLTVTDNVGQTGTAAKVLHIVEPGVGPEPAFTASGSAVVNEPIAFDASGSTAPAGRTIAAYAWNFGDGTTGSGVQATHAYGKVGTYAAVLTVTDDQGAQGQAQLLVTVTTQPNRNPTLSAQVPAKGLQGALLTFRATGSDPDGDVLTYSWDFGDGTTATGATATHAYAAAGVYSGSVQADDGRGGTATVPIGVEVIEKPTTNVAPVAVPVGPLAGRLNEPIAFDGSASYDLNEDVLTYAWDFGDGAFGSGATASHAFSSKGLHTVTLTVEDPSGLRGTASTSLTVVDPSDTTPPSASLASPQDDAVITAPVDVVGSVNDADLKQWRVEYAPSDTQDFTVIASGSTAVASQTLATFDPTVLANGFYVLRLVAEDFNLNRSAVEVLVQVKGSLKLGLFSLSFTDLEVPMAGIPLKLTRTYDSRDRSKGDFGYGWRLGLQSYPKVVKGRKEGDGWDMQQVPGGFLPNFCLVGAKAHRVTVELPDGRSMDFAFDPQPTCQLLYRIDFAEAAYTPISHPGTKLEPLGGRDLMVLEGDLYDFDLNVYNPDDFKLTLEDGTAYWVKRKGGVSKIQDRNGNSIEFRYDGIIHSGGQSVTFQRDAQGLITSITPPGSATSLTYEYSNGDLTGATDRTGAKTSFTYVAGHYLDQVKDPLNRPVMRNEYDARGRLVAQTDAYGKRTTFEHRLDENAEYLYDRLGNLLILKYDGKGNVIERIDAEGHSWLYEYDARGNRIKEEDPLGNQKLSSYDGRDHLLWRKVVAAGTGAVADSYTYTYDAKGFPLTEVGPLGGVKSYAYDAKGNVIEVHDPAGGVTAYTYNAAGQKTRQVDALGNATRYEYDALGRLVKEIDPLGHAQQNEYDQEGRLVRTTRTRTVAGAQVAVVRTLGYDGAGNVVTEQDANGGVTHHTYDALGHRTSVTRPDATTISYEYNARGDLVKTTYPDGTTEEAEYDVEGHKLKEWDRAGRLTEYAYDKAGRLIRAAGPDGAVTENAYDGAGRRISETKLGGGAHSTTYAYDGAGRQVQVTDALGNTTTNVYDAAGRRIRMDDALGRSTLYSYDKLGNQTRVTFPDSTSKETVFDLLGRKAAEKDQAGLFVGYEYDAAGRLIKVIDPAWHETLYEYDELGNRVQQTDANGRVTTWTFDNVGHTTSRTLPLGMSEAFEYDARGNVVEHVDFAGRTFMNSYDPDGKLLAVRYPDGSTVSYTYTPTGRRASETDRDGVTTQYAYDPADRLTRVEKAGAPALQYSYDAFGNRSTMTTNAGVTSYEYDLLDRLVVVTDPAGRATQFAYDAVGNRTRLLYPNGIEARYTYDSLNRLTALDNVGPGGGTLSTYAYTLGPAGNKLTAVESGARTVAYQYDVLYRLTGEVIVDPAGNDTVSYTYDAVGNRLTKVDRTGTVVYTYDPNDRLVGELGPGYVYAYSYDANGNRTGRSGLSGPSDTYVYDFDNRLTRVTSGANSLGYAYDVDGLRVAEDVNGVETSYLFDKNRTYAAVVEELASNGVPRVTYTWGDTVDPLYAVRTGTPSAGYYLADGFLNIRQIADDSALVTDAYALDGFGNVLHRSGSTPNPYLLQGQHYDANVGFYYLRARWLDPRTGTFTSLDPAVGSLFEPASLHKYVFARNNPLSYFDPGGKQFSLVEVSVSLSIDSTLMKAYVSMCAKIFMKSMEIIHCIIEPGFRAESFGLDLVDDPELSDIGIEIWELGRNMVAEGFQEMYKMMVEAGKEFAESLLPKINVGVTVAFETKNRIIQLLAAGYSAYQDIQEKLDKVQKAVDSMNAIVGAIDAFCGNRNCDFWRITNAFVWDGGD